MLKNYIDFAVNVVVLLCAVFVMLVEGIPNGIGSIEWTNSILMLIFAVLVTKFTRD